MSTERVNVQAMRLEAGAMRTSHWWAEHAEALAALLDVAEAARKVDAATVYGNGDDYDDPNGINKEFWAALDELANHVARLDFGDAC